jgi:hypothetical protein
LYTIEHKKRRELRSPLTPLAVVTVGREREREREREKETLQ